MPETCDHPRPVHRFTRENAREYAKRGNARKAELAKARLTAPPEPAPVVAPREDDFTTARLIRVRRQLERVDQMIEEETDPQKLDRLAAASMRLSDQEFALANRPKPANAKLSTRQSHRSQPWIVQPSVVPPPTPSVPEPKQLLDIATTPQLPKP